MNTYEATFETLNEFGTLLSSLPEDFPQKSTERITQSYAEHIVKQVNDLTPKPLPQPQLIQKLEQSIAARTPEPHRVGFVVVDKETNELDWSNEVYYSAQEAIDDMVSCGNYTDTDPTSGRYWGNIYAIKPVTFA